MKISKLFQFLFKTKKGVLRFPKSQQKIDKEFLGLKGSETEKNLLKAFAGESQARNRYTYFASVAKKEGYEQISAIFLETADNEKEHAKIFFQHLNEIGEPVEITAKYPAGKISTTAENLLNSANGENEEWGVLYPHFEKTARREGFEEMLDLVFQKTKGGKGKRKYSKEQILGNPQRLYVETADKNRGMIKSDSDSNISQISLR